MLLGTQVWLSGFVFLTPQSSTQASADSATSNGDDVKQLKITFEGVFQDGNPRAMPGNFVCLGGGLDPDATGAALALRLLSLTKEMQAKKQTVGFFSMQAGDAVFVSAGPDRLHERYGRIGGRDAGKVIPALKLNQKDSQRGAQLQAQDSEKHYQDLQFDGVVDVVGGGWENAVYRVELVHCHMLSLVPLIVNPVS